ncbi:MAG: HAD family phosphatase [Chitinophagales bacterium]
MHFIKNIIFDLGGVIINLDMSATEAAFYKLLGEKAHVLKSPEAQQQIFYPFEKGKISDIQFRQYIRDFTGENLSDSEIDAAWNAMLGSIPIERLNFLNKIKNNYRIFLLSNTNTIHYRAFNQILNRAHQLEDLSSFFENCYYSQQVAMRKPDAEIFEHVLTQNGLVPEETLFLDDTLMHLEGASELGIHVEQVKAERDIFSILSDFKY